MHEKPNIPQEQIDHELATRTLSDAELIQDGAAFQNGVLKITDEQYEDLAQKGDTAQKLGVLVLHSPMEEEADTPSDVLEKEAMNIKNLQDEITEVLAPYVGLFADKIPAPADNPRTWRGKLKNESQAVPEWQTERIVGNSEVTYDFSVRYKPGEKHNDIEDVSIDIMPKGMDKHYKEPLTLRLGYSDTQIGLIELNKWNIHNQFTEDIFGVEEDDKGSYRWGNPFGGFLDAVGELGDVQIKLDNTIPTILVSSRFTSDCEYRYNPETDNFILIGDREFGFSRDAKERPETISKDEFLRIVQGSLQLIPTIER